jgi:hypothetical protein
MFLVSLSVLIPFEPLVAGNEWVLYGISRPKVALSGSRRGSGENRCAFILSEECT